MRKLLTQTFLISFLLFNTEKLLAQYCTPSYTSGCVVQDQIESFSTTLGITNITNNNNGCAGNAPSYTTYFSNMTVTQVQGQSFNFSVQANAAYQQGFRIWVDWNQNNSFADPGEDVWNSVTWGTTPYTGTINVPITALPGITRMRVLCRFATLPLTTDYCATNMSYGETEDYNVSVVSATPCSGTPNTGTITQVGSCPSTLMLTGATIQANINVQWQSRLACGGTWTNIPGATQWNYTLPSFSQPTQFRVYFLCTNSNLTDTSAPITVNSVTPCYCASASSSNFYNNITNVTFATINNSSVCANTYTNFSNTVPPPRLLRGEQFNFTLTSDNCYALSQFGNYGVAVFIDLNRDGTYATSERVFAPATTYSGQTFSVSGTITIPTTASNGQTGMRVILASSGAGNNITGCWNTSNSYTYGETEDYIVNIEYAPTITGTGLVNGQVSFCSGQSATLTASAPGVSNPMFLWKKPNNGGWDTSTTLTFNNLQPTQAGNYFAYILTPGCPGAPPDTSAARMVN
ncbi:MAG TPA: GEVED domain-containing protein, partial [Flavipsychrobacter sp.]|nr:GEVED domain-containing protein [Flavipsychrobacter sp.]